MKVSLIKNVKSHSVVKELTIAEIAEMIKSGIDDTHITNQKHLRTLSGKDQIEFKEKNFAAYTPHGSFHYVETASLKELSGVVYIDIDNPSNLAQTKQELANNPFVHAIYTSIRGNGLGILVKVQTEGLSEESFRGKDSVIHQVAKVLGIKLDENAKGLARPNIIPFDPEISFTPNSLTFKPKFSNEDKKTTSAEVRAFLHNSSDKYLTQTLLEDYQDRDYIVTPEGTDYIDTFIVNRAIPEGRRNSTLRAIAVANLYNNSNKPEKAHLARLVNINNEYCKPAVKYDEVISIHQSIYKQYKEGKLQVNSRKKFIWFNPKSELGKNEKQSIAAKEFAKIKKDRTKSLIHNAISHFQDEEIIINQKVIAEFTGKSLRTIKSYWSEFKDQVNEINFIIKEKNHDTISQPNYQPESKIQINYSSIKENGVGVHDNGDNEMLGEGTEEVRDDEPCIDIIAERKNSDQTEIKLVVPFYSQKKFLEDAKQLKYNDLIELQELGRRVQILTVEAFVKNNENILSNPLPF